MKKRLDWKPESLESAKARFPKALEKLWDADAVADNPKLKKPGQYRCHVFDFEDGVRMIASREKSAEANDGKPILHLSFGLHDQQTTYKPNDIAFKYRVHELLFIFAGTHERYEQSPVVTRRAVHFILNA